MVEAWLTSHGTALKQLGSLLNTHTREAVVVQHGSNTFLDRISKALRANFDEVAKEPLPQRWIDLIRYLNERERAETRQPQPERPSKHRSH